jgi:hypothetical protein
VLKKRGKVKDKGELSMAMADMAVAAASPQQQQQQPKPAAKVAKKAPAASNVKANRIGGVEMRVPDRMEVDMARQDVHRVCNPDIKRPFSSIEDACDRCVACSIVVALREGLMFFGLDVILMVVGLLKGWRWFW